MGLFGSGILYFIFCIVVGCAASNRGRSGIGYFFLSLILSPLIAFIIILVLGENRNIRRERIYEEAEIKESVSLRYKDEAHNDSVFRNASNNLIPYNDTKKCPFCAELIKKEAIICRFCGRDIKDYENEIILKIENVLKSDEPVKGAEKTSSQKIDELERLFDSTDDENEKIEIAKKLYELGKLYYWRFIPREK